MTDIVDLGVFDSRLQGLERPPSNRVTSGLARALSDRLGIDVLLVRAGFVILTLITGIGLALYLWGTLLTPRAGSTPPITRVLPAFRRWSPLAQWLIIGLTSTMIVVARGDAVGASLAAVVLVGTAVAFIVSRFRRPRSIPGYALAEATVGQPVPRTAHQEPHDPHEELPLIDLYGEESTAPPPPRRDWPAAALALLAGIVAALISAVLGIGGGSAAFYLCLGAAATGAVTVLSTILRRGRRLPGLVLLVFLTMASATAVMVHQATGHDPFPPGITQAAETNHTVIDDPGAILDLRDVEEGPIHVNVINSDLEIIWPHGAQVEVDDIDSELEGVFPRSGSTRNPVSVEVNAINSTVTGRHP